MINQTWLRTFLTLVETGHFTRTAERLHMTQPGVTQHIQKLEQQIGQPLLTRIGKKFELTEAGHLLTTHGQTQQRQEVEFFDAIQHNHPDAGDCRFACSGSLAMLLYPEFLRHQASHPRLTVSLEAAPNRRIHDAIKDDVIDLGIVTTRSGAQELTEMHIGSQPLQLVLPKAKTTDKAPSYAELQDLGFINHPDGHHYAGLVLGENYSRDFKGMADIPCNGYINQLGQILLPVAQGLGFTVLPEFAVRLFPDQGNIRTVALPNPVSEDLFLIHKRHRPLAARYTWFVETIRRLIA